MASDGTRNCCRHKCINVGFDQLRYLCFATSIISQMRMFLTSMDCLSGIWLKCSTSNGLRSEIQTTVTFASSPPIAVHGFAWYLAPRNWSCSTNVPLTLLSSTTPGKTLALVDELNSITSPCRCHPDLCAQLPSWPKWCCWSSWNASRGKRKTELLDSKERILSEKESPNFLIRSNGYFQQRCLVWRRRNYYVLQLQSLAKCYCSSLPWINRTHLSSM